MLTAKEFVVVCATDDAIDLEQSNLDRYVITRDITHLKFKPGQEPMRYTLRRVPNSLVATWIDVAADDNLKRVRAFMASVVGWCGRKDENGRARGEEKPDWCTKPNAPPSSTMTLEELDMFHPEDIADIGAVAYERCFLRPGREPLYQASHSFRAGLERVLSHHVAKSLPDLFQKLGGDSPLQVQLRALSGEKDTDATVKAKTTTKQKTRRQKSQRASSSRSKR